MRSAPSSPRRAGLASWRLRVLPHALIGMLVAGAIASVAVRPPWIIWIAALVAGMAGGLALRRGRVAATAGLVAATLGLTGWAWGGARIGQTAPAPLVLPGAAIGTVDIDTSPQAVRGGVRVRVHAVDLRIGAREVPRGTRFLADLPDGVGVGPGVRLRVTGRARVPADASAPGWWRAYLARNLIAARLQVKGVPAGRRGGVLGLRDRLRDAAGRAAGAGVEGEPRVIVRGLALGGGAGLSEATAQSFRDAGIWHLLAVSGQNVAIIARAVLTLLGAFALRRRSAVGVSLVVIVVYCLACDGGASVARAGVMGALMVVAELCSRAGDRWHLVLAGLATLVLIQPRAIGDPGLQLSFAAVAGMYLVADPMTRWLVRALPKPVASLLAQAVGATLATAPVIVWHFGAISLIGLVANLLAVPLATPIVVSALVGIGAGWLMPQAGELVNQFAGLGGVALIAVARVASAVPGATATLPAWSAPVVALPMVVTVWWIRRSGSARPVRPFALPTGRAAAAVAAVGVLAVALAIEGSRGPRWPAVATLTALDIGQGDALLLRSPDGAAALVDTGPPGRAAPVLDALRRSGVHRLSWLILTHDQTDHAGAADAVLAHFDVRVVGTSMAVPAAERAAGQAGVAVRRIAAGDRFTVGVWSVDVLSPAAGARTEDPNDASVVLVARAPGLTALLTGDAESAVVSRVARERIDVLKVSHHGSVDDGLSALLRRLHPALALISVGRGNRYGHPAPSTLSALQGAGVNALRTDVAGDVVVSAVPGGLALTTSRSR